MCPEKETYVQGPARFIEKTPSFVSFQPAVWHCFTRVPPVVIFSRSSCATRTSTLAKRRHSLNARARVRALSTGARACRATGQIASGTRWLRAITSKFCRVAGSRPARDYLERRGLSGSRAHSSSICSTTGTRCHYLRPEILQQEAIDAGLLATSDSGVHTVFAGASCSHPGCARACDRLWRARTG